MNKFVFVLVILLFPMQVFAADYYVDLSSDNDCSDSNCTLQAALDAAAANEEDDTISITQAGVYHGPFLIPRNDYSIAIEGSRLLNREHIILDNPTAAGFPGMPCVGTIATGFEEVSSGLFRGTAFTLKHLTITSAQLIGNESMEGDYNDGLAPGWSKHGNILPTEIVYDFNQGKYVLAGSSAQRFTNCQTVDDYIETTVTGLNVDQEYGFSAWLMRISGTGTVNIELIGAATRTLSSTTAYFKREDYKFTAATDSLTIRLYNTGDAATKGVVEEISLRSLIETGIIVKGAPANGSQEITDCVIKHIGQVVNGLDDPSVQNCLTGDDIHGVGIAICGGAYPLITDCDIRNNYDGVEITDHSLDPDTQDANPRFWSTGYEDDIYGQIRQRIRFNARFGIAAKNGATPYIGDSGIRSWPLSNANNIQANGFAAIACRDDAAPRIYYNIIEGNLDYLFTTMPRNPSGYGVIAQDRAAPVLVGNSINDLNRAAVVMRDESTPEIGECGEWINDQNDVRVNHIFDNNLYTRLNESDPDYIFCGLSGNDANEGCAAISVRGFAKPSIKNNYIYNNWAGIGISEWAVPTVQGNWFTWNTVGIGIRNLQLSEAVEVKIGGSGQNELNRIYKNDKGLMVKGSGNPFFRVIIEGNRFTRNYIKAIGANNSYLEIRNNYIHNNDGAGIGFKNSTNALIVNNEIINGMSGAAVAGRDSFIHLENNVIVGNQLGRFGPVVMLRAGYPTDQGQPGYTGAGSTGVIRHNIIVGGKTWYLPMPGYRRPVYKAYGVEVVENSRIKELKHNIIGRLFLGVIVESGSVVDPGAVDYNLVYAWSSNDNDGYALGSGNLPGPHTYYYGEGYGNAGTYFGYSRPDPFFMDPDNKLSTVVDYKIDPDSPVWSYTAEAGYNPYLGLPADYNYQPPQSWYSMQGPLKPYVDNAAPVVTAISPGNGASSTPEIVVWLKDKKDGIIGSSVELYVNGNSVIPDITPAVSNASNYKLSYIPPDPFDYGDIVTVGVVAQDAMGNIFDTTSNPYTFSVEPAPGDAQAPYLTGHVFGTDCSIRKDTPIIFHIEDDGVGVDAVTMNVEGIVDPVPITNTDIHDYVINYKPPHDFSYSQTVTVDITATDFNGNQLSDSYSFCIEPDTNPPEDVTYFMVYIDEETCSWWLTWEPSIDSEEDLSEQILYVCSGEGGLELVCENGDWTEMARLGASVTDYKLANLAEGKYRFMLSVVDEADNESNGNIANTGNGGELYVCNTCSINPQETIADLKNIISTFPDSAFKKNKGKRKKKMLKKLDTVLSIIRKAEKASKPFRQDRLYQKAIKKLQNNILTRTDGCYGGLSKNDWVVDCQYQGEIYSLILELIYSLENRGGGCCL